MDDCWAPFVFWLQLLSLYRWVRLSMETRLLSHTQVKSLGRKNKWKRPPMPLNWPRNKEIKLPCRGYLLGIYFFVCWPGQAFTSAQKPVKRQGFQFQVWYMFFIISNNLLLKSKQWKVGSDSSNVSLTIKIRGNCYGIFEWISHKFSILLSSSSSESEFPERYLAACDAL